MRNPRSCYVLELSVQPGGSRWAELHTYTNPSEIGAWLRGFCRNEQGLAAYHAIWYGATLAVWVVQRGEVVQQLDVHPFIRVRHPEEHAEWVQLDDDRRLLEMMLRLTGEEQEEGEDQLEMRDVEYERYEELQMNLDWDPLAALLPPLQEPLLAPAETTPVRHREKPRIATYLRREVTHGSVELEGGDVITPRAEG